MCNSNSETENGKVDERGPGRNGRTSLSRQDLDDKVVCPGSKVNCVSDVGLRVPRPYSAELFG